MKIVSGILVFLTGLSISTVSYAGGINFLCNTSKHHVEVSASGSNVYIYRSWNKPKSTHLTPDMEVGGGRLEADGTGPCTHSTYIFVKGKIRFEVGDDIRCGPDEPPKGATGNLSVFINDELKSSYWCMKGD